MASRQGGVDSEPNRIYEVAPKAVAPRAVASNIIFLAAWLAGTAACFLSILATTLAQCARWFPFILGIAPLAALPERTSRRPSRPKPIMTRPLLSRENVERHVSFPLDSRTGRDIPQPHPPSTDNMTCTTASFSSGDSTLCSSPLSDLGDLPPLKNLPPLLLDPQTPDQIPTVKRPWSANFPSKTRNPFKFRRVSTSSAPSPTPEIGEILPVPTSIGQPLTSPTEPGPRKPSLLKRLNMKGRRAHSVSTITGSPSSTPTSPMLSPLPPRDTPNRSKRSASMDVPTQTLGSPVFAPPSPHQSSPRRILFGSFTRGSRTMSPPPAPARTQPYGPPYNCPLPIPQPRRSSGTRRPTTNTQTSAPLETHKSP